MTPKDEPFCAIKPYVHAFILEQRHRVSTRPSFLRDLRNVIEGVALYVIWRVLMMLDK